MKTHPTFSSIIVVLAMALSAVVQAGPIKTPSLKGGCALSDWSSATDCVGLFEDANDHGQRSIFNTPELTDKFGSDFMNFDPEGFTFTGVNGTSGMWSTSTNAFAGFDTVLLVIKAGQFASAYEIDTSFFSGTWNIAGENWLDLKGRRGVNHALSHFGFWGRRGGGGDANPVPEPATLTLFASGLFALYYWRRQTVAVKASV